MISKSSEYTLRIMLFLAGIDPSEKASVTQISEAVNTPYRYTAKLLQDIRRKNLISAQKGPNGGYYLESAQINKSLLDIMTAFNDGEFLTTCILGLPRCSDEHPCPVHAKYQGIRAQLHALFADNTIEAFSDLSDTYLRR